MREGLRRAPHALTTQTRHVSAAMDVFDLDQAVIDRYERFTRSFTKIRSPELNREVTGLYGAKSFWPEPLVQLNPHYAFGCSIQDFVETGELEPECAEIFPSLDTTSTSETLRLWKHQEQAVGLALQDRSFAVTTGTGSGKSLCFFIPIINAAIRARKTGLPQKTRAIVIYPMNALANSQAEELKRYLRGVGDHIPTYARYTGQEQQDERNRIATNPPDILLTNFMMLELLMTRQSEVDRRVIANCQGFRFLVLDELHTYRGRQGADVAMLIRRVKARIGDPDHAPICIGTSATMASEGPEESRNKIVAQVASEIFSAEISPDTVITETLRRVTDESKSGNGDLPDLEAAVRRAMNPEAGEARSNWHLQNDDLAIWIETRIGLKSVEIKPERRRPVSLQEAAEALSAETSVEPEGCRDALRNALLKFSQPEKDRGVEGGSALPLFAFKLHRFISGGGSLYTTLATEGDRFVTLSGQVFNPNEPTQRLYSTYFCRTCGQEFHPVTLCSDTSIQYFEKRDIDDIPVESGANTNSTSWGFLIPADESLESTFRGRDADYPDSWKEGGAKGDRLKYHYRKWRAQPYKTEPSGRIGSGLPCWFLPGKFRWCPRCLVVADARARDINKLASLSAEGRSSATTVLIASILEWMQGDACDLAKHQRKLLAFADNRQDAALQAGHFNDFVFVTLLRAAVLSALRAAGSNGVPAVEMGRRMQEALGFLASMQHTRRAEEWLQNPRLKGGARESAAILLGSALQHRFWIDQKRAWRVSSPNLEQLGLIEARYSWFEEAVRDDEEFHANHLLRNATPAERGYALKTVLDFMRIGLALKSPEVEEQHLNQLSRKMIGQIRRPWLLPDEQYALGSVLMLDPPAARKISHRDNERILRGTSRSALGRQIRALEFGGIQPKPAEMSGLLHTLLMAAKNYGIAEEKPFLDHGAGWILLPVTISYAIPSEKSDSDTSNEFFAALYRSAVSALEADRSVLMGMESREHTAQVESEVRELRELRFRYGSEEQNSLREDRLQDLQKHGESGRFLPAMVCSPTMELGVDISSMNVVYLRNAPPTPANYAQRSGRGGRSGQAALVLSYCAARSPHDQYFFNRRKELVAGVVRPPSIDLTNQELVMSHLQAEWLAATGVDLDPTIGGNLDLGDLPQRPLHHHIQEEINSRNARERGTDTSPWGAIVLGRETGRDKSKVV